jgi:hypothetical protein
MFKAKLIEREGYYKLRRRQLLIIVLITFPMGVIVSTNSIPLWAILLVIGISIPLMIFMLRNRRLIDAILNNRTIEIDTDEIRIKTKKGTIAETIILQDVDKLSLLKQYALPQETMKDLSEELSGKAIQNKVILQQNGTIRKFDFEIESHYMVNQINKLIEHWKTQGLTN